MPTDRFSSDDGFRLREYLGVLRVRKWSIMAIAVLALAGALFYAKQQTPMFQAVARVQATNPTGTVTSQNPIASAPTMPTEQALVGSETVVSCAWVLADAANAAGDASGTSGTPTDLCGDNGKLTPGVTAATPPPWFHAGLAASTQEGTTILAIAFNSPDRAIAQLSAESFARSYVWFKTFTAEAKVDDLRGPLLKQQRALESQVAEATQSLIDSAGAGDAQTVAALQTQLNALNNQLEVLNQQLLQTNPAKIDPPTIVADAALPGGPVSPKVPLLGIAGLMVGLAFGVGLAFVREQLDDRLRGRADVESRLGAPVLVVVPQVQGWKRHKDTHLITIEQPKSAVAESYRTLRTGILFAAAQRGIRSIMVVSPTAGEGKTTTAANLAVVLADAGKRVILVSCDLRKPRVHVFFGLGNEVGLSSVLIGEKKPWEALQDPKRENLKVMASGPVPGAPAELLQSEQMGELVEELLKVSDFLILDTAPLLLVADALALTPFTDGVLFVADAENTTRGAVMQSRDQLEQLGAQVIGTVLNNFDPAKAKAYSNSYGGHYYGYGKGYYGGKGGYYGQDEIDDQDEPPVRGLDTAEEAGRAT